MIGQLQTGFELHAWASGLCYLVQAGHTDVIACIEQVTDDNSPANGQWFSSQLTTTGFTSQAGRVARAIGWGASPAEAANHTLEALNIKPPQLYVTRNDAIEKEIIEPLEAGDDDLTGPVEDAYDVDAIADEILITTGAGTRYRFLRDPAASFWDTAARHSH
mgnify:FL=1